MIPRYDRSEIAKIWTEEYKFQTYLDVELSILAAQEGRKIRSGLASDIRKKVAIRPERIGEIEREVQHDVIAFCTSITEQLPPEMGKYFHFGVTSSDIIDTALSVQVKRSLEIILPSFRELLAVLWKMANETKDLITIGRSHGMYAEPMSFGQKLLGHYAEFYRRYQDLVTFMETECTAQFSGAVGNYTILTPEVEAKAAHALGLAVEPVSTQVIPRDRLAKLLSIHALVAGAVERLSVEIRHLHRSEVAEVEEGFSPGQKGSSIMPHKKNPISGENLTGLSRVVRSHATVALENMVLWHERDISHSSAERMILPDNFGLVFYILERLKGTLSRLEVNRTRIEERVLSSFSYLSGYYLHHLLEHTSLTREDAYKVIQGAAFSAQNPQQFHQAIQRALTTDHQEFSLPTPDKDGLKLIYMKHVNEVFRRTEKLYPHSPN